MASNRKSEAEVLLAKDYKGRDSGGGVRCSVCDSRGHVAKDCRSKKGKRGRRSQSSSPSDRVSELHLADNSTDESLCSIGDSFFLSLHQACSTFSDVARGPSVRKGPGVTGAIGKANTKGRVKGATADSEFPVVRLFRQETLRTVLHKTFHFN